MRLLECDHGKLSLTKNLVVNIPQYAILSHTWGPDADEVTFQDVTDGTGRDKPGYEKIKFCAEQVVRDGLQYFWIDTCCIDQSNNNEVSEAINSMFRWYGNAARCYVYLSDVLDSEQSGQQPGLSWASAFRLSRWFERGWTLQELLAPASVEFFTRDGQRLGDKQSLEREIHEITGIAVPALQGSPLSQFSVEERLKWADNRRTTRDEDWAYCLLGIFGVFMSPIYGEGKEHAIHRLKKEIGLPGLLMEHKPPRPWFLVPYPENPAFIGRESILEKLRKQPFGLTSQSRMALFGLGGIGKTQIALAHAYWLQKAHPEVSIFWVHASSAERFRQAFASIAHECQVPGHDDPKADILSLVKTWLERKEHGRWLMVVDNADDTQLFFGLPEESGNAGAAGQEARLGCYVPECAHGSILITTRNKQAGLRLTKGVSPTEVTKMDDDESVQLLRTRLEEHDADEGELFVLSSQLDHLPLALVQAAAFIQENSMVVSEYLQLLDGTDGDFVDLLSQEFETVGRDSETPRAVTQAWMISFEQIQQQNALAGELLSLMAFFDRQAIAPEFLSCYGEQHQDGGQGKIQLQKALGVLKAFCVVTVAKDQSMDIHRLVQLVTRKWLASKGIGKWFAEQALIAVSEQYPFGEYENWMGCGRYLPHVYAVLEHEGIGSVDGQVARGALLHNAAQYLVDQGLWEEAERLQEEVVAVRRVTLGQEDQSTLASMGNLASIYKYQGRWDEAEKLEVQVTETFQVRLGYDHPDTLTGMDNLASTLLYQGRWDEAEKLFVLVMETRQAKLGADHPDTLTSMANLASTYGVQGQWGEAEKMNMQVMETRKTKLGTDHPDTLKSMGNLASTFWNLGRWEEAEKLEVQVMGTRQATLGADHPDTLTSIANLASIYRRQGRWDKAEKLEVQVIETRKAKLGVDHPSTLTSMANLASTFLCQSRWAEAEKLFVQVMETRKAKLGSNHPDTLTSIGNLASTLWHQGRWDEAEKMDVQVLENRKAKLGPDHPDTLTSMANLASTYRNQGRLDKAEELEVQVTETFQAKLGPDHPNTLTSMGNLALTYWNQGRWDEAEKLEVQVMETRKTKLGADHPDTLTSMANMASTHRSQGRWDEAEKLEVQVMETRQAKLGADHPDTLTSMANMASTHRSQGRWDEAEKLEVQVMETRKTKLGADHPDTLTSMNNLAFTWKGIGRHQDALDLINTCYQLRQRRLGPYHPYTQSTFRAMTKWRMDTESKSQEGYTE